jgi:hypothetical protein
MLSRLHSRLKNKLIEEDKLSDKVAENLSKLILVRKGHLNRDGTTRETQRNSNSLHT